MQKRIMVLLLCFALFLTSAAPAWAAQETLIGTLGETGASINISTGTTAASASASASYSVDSSNPSADPTPVDSATSVSAATNTNPGSDSHTNSASSTQTTLDQGCRITTATANTSASCEYGATAGQAQASENVADVTILAPAGLSFTNALVAVTSLGSSQASITDLMPVAIGEIHLQQEHGVRSYAASTHFIGETQPGALVTPGDSVSLFDDIILFDGAQGSAAATVLAGTPSAEASASVLNLRVWDRNTGTYSTAGYASPLNVSSTWTANQLSDLISALNTLLILENIRVVRICETSTELVSTRDFDPPSAKADATALEVALLKDGEVEATMVLCNDHAEANLTSALARDIEAMMRLASAPADDPGTPSPTPTPPAQPQTPAAQTVSSSSSSGSGLPLTGADLSLSFFLALGLIGTGVGLRRRSSELLK